MISSNLFEKDGPLIMGIVNVTPDSFSDGGRFYDPKQAIEHAMTLIEEGADILDIGGESTRPGSAPVTVEEEQKRVLPVVEALAHALPHITISIDTRHPETMAKAIECGASMVNDVTGMGSSDALDVCNKYQPYICIMHMLGNPKTMQENPLYNNVLEDVLDFLHQRIEACIKAGIRREKICVDPGIGFGKTLNHTRLLLRNLDRFCDLGVPILLGTSRKSFIPKMLDNDLSTDARLPGSLSSFLWGLSKGVKIFRVHDVAETCQAFAVWQSIQTAAD